MLSNHIPVQCKYSVLIVHTMYRYMYAYFVQVHVQPHCIVAVHMGGDWETIWSQWGFQNQYDHKKCSDNEKNVAASTW